MGQRQAARAANPNNTMRIDGTRSHPPLMASGKATRFVRIQASSPGDRPEETSISVTTELLRAPTLGDSVY
jgi:hypothetical protein